MKIFLKKLFKKLKRPAKVNFLTFHIECGKCNEKIKVLVNKKTDLMNQYPEPNSKKVAYILKKEVLGNNCQNLMELKINFNKSYEIMDCSVTGGRLINDN